MLEADLVLLSATDSKATRDEVDTPLREGMEISIYMDDLDERGQPDDLIASGVVERNLAKGWAEHVKWCCRIDGNGIRNQSDL
ncbi:hypothetical protein [uncultured Erythrobacter sp.]|uniref:hypothetical protein n=1 Tax=uncultured Erythrobacter sp. TaxID=263913 RepID=UPI00261A81C3|nr:hypothetical protein [uncultured Erythrobacter sp.]